MDLYLKREKEISLQEWIDYVRTDKDLLLMETGEAINPVTKQRMKMKIAGRTLFDGTEIIYKKGRIGCDDPSEKVLAKLKELAQALGAEIFEY